MDLYSFLKFIHVVLVIVSVGFAVSYSLWLARAAGEPQHVPFALRGVKFLDDWVANPGFGLILVFGLAMVFVGGLRLTTFWVLAALILWIILVVVRLVALRPNIGSQIRIVAEGRAGSPEHLREIGRLRIIGPFLGLVSLAIILVMVVKPVP